MSNKEAVGFLSDLTLAFLFGVIPMPVVWKWLGWFLCWMVFQYIILSTYLNMWPRKTRAAGFFVLTLGFVLVFEPVAISQWHEEKAMAVEGDLVGAGEEFNDRQVRMIPPVQIADSGTKIFQPPGSPPFWQPFPDAKLTLEAGKKGPLISTTIRDAEGHTVASIDKNQWKVFAPFCADKNYTYDGTALEILDSSLHVVFQLKFTIDAVQIQGEWWDNQGNGKRILKDANGLGSVVEFLGPRQKKNEDLIKPIFVYPSSKHWQEFIH